MSDSRLVTARTLTLEESAARRYAMAHDASHYLLVPETIATPSSVAEIQALLAYCRDEARHLTFRSGGTSLSGQASSDGVLVDVRKYFRGVEVLDDGLRVRVQPGATVRHVNATLHRHSRKLGPDPASEVACTMGGVIANNSSGMTCGVTQNTYRTLESLVVVLASGTVIDTAAPDADDCLRRAEPGIHLGLTRLRERVLAQPESLATIARLFSMKNTMGYGINALVDFERPVDILRHLMIGSEGTLGFIASATFRTVPLEKHATTGLAVFDSLRDATAALPALEAAGLATIELLDARSLTVAQGLREVPEEIAGLEISRQAALLLEHHGQDPEQMVALAEASRSTLEALDLAAPLDMTGDAARRARLWGTRKGLYTAVAQARPSGTSALLEDIAVPVPALLPTCEALEDLFEQHGYEESVIFGHAKDGNIHFMLNESFQAGAGLGRFRRFTEEMVDLVLHHGGTLKAEHGTGRVMAPYVRRQYGDELYEVMTSIKELLDPGRILNPGAVLTEEPDSFLDHLKVSLPVEEEVDRCVECGYCEPACPSKNLTLTPRQRIALRRDLAAAKARGDEALHAELTEAYRYDGVDTCAVDGMCQVACPVNINTGELVKRLRAEGTGTIAQAGWKMAAQGWGPATVVGSAALTAAAALPGAAGWATRMGRSILGADTMPQHSPDLPRGGSRRRARRVATPDALFFPACVGTLFGSDGEGAARALDILAERTGITWNVPEGIGAMCCGTPWRSKGKTEGHATMAERVLPRLWEASQHGALPVVVDASSCTEGIEQMRAEAAAQGRPEGGLRIVDALELVAKQMLPRLTVTAPVASIALHPTCSNQRRSTTPALEAIARFLSDDVTLPVAWGCCGFAGDRGMLHPELTASATAAEAAEVTSREYAVHASSNRTCEIGMTRATGRPYVHIVEVLEEATRARG